MCVCVCVLIKCKNYLNAPVNQVLIYVWGIM